MAQRVTQRLAIRAASARDAQAVASLRRSVCGEGRWFLADADEAPSVAAVEADLVALDRHPGSRVFLGLRGDQLVAACWLRGGQLRRNAHETGMELMVDQTQRGRGVGRRVLRHAIAWAQGQPGLTRLALAVMADNDRAIALYRAHGFTQEGLRRGAVQDGDGQLRDDLLMALDVSEARDDRGG